MPLIECCYHRDVTHIGFLDTPEARRASLDGPGISVTTCPESWRALKGLNGPEFTLSFSAGQWVDAMTFSDEDIDDIRRWALKNQYLRETMAWFALVEERGDFLPRAFATRKEAAAAVGRTLEVEEAAAERSEGATWQEQTCTVSPRGMRALERWPGPLEQWQQAVILLYIREVVIPKRPYVVGVWWSEPDDAQAGCAPSGVLFPERLHHFEVEDEEGEVKSFADRFPQFEAPEDPLVAYE